MENSIILPIDVIKSVRQYLNSEQNNTDWDDVFFQALLQQEGEAARIQEPNETSKDRKSASKMKSSGKTESE